MTSVPRAVVPYDPFAQSDFATAARLSDLPFINLGNSPYNALVNGTDETAKLQSASAALNAVGGGTLYIPFGATGVLGVTSVLASTLFTFTNLNGIRILGEGVTITDSTVYAAGQDANLIDFVACKNISVSGVNFAAPRQATTYPSAHGLAFVTLKEGCSVVTIDASFDGGFAGLGIYKADADPDSYRSTLVTAKIRADHVQKPYYTINAAENCKVQIDATYCGRDFVLLGARLQKIDLTTRDEQGAAQVLMQDGQSNEDIEIRIRDRNSTARVPANPQMLIQWSDTTPAALRRAKIHLDVLSNGGAATFNAAVGIDKLSGGVADVVGRGHIIDGMEISGLFDTADVFDTVSMIGAFAAPDIVRNVSFHHIVSPNTLSGINFAAGDALQDVIEVSNCYVPAGPINVTATTGAVVIRETIATNHLGEGAGAAIPSVAGVITPTARRQHVTGALAITGITATQFADGETWTVVPDGAFTWTAAGNIAVAGTAVVNRTLVFTWDATAGKWTPSYV